MTLKEGLLRKLNDNDEPLPKRLKVADKAFKCPEVNFQNREVFFLKWILQEEVSHRNNESWEQFGRWLASDNFKQLRTTDLTNEDINDILNTIAKEFKLKETILQFTLTSVISSLFESPVFQIYLRNNVEVYMEFVKSVIKSINDDAVMLKLLRNERLLSKKILISNDCHNIFMEEIFPCFVNICLRFSLTEESELYNVLIDYICKFVFAKRQKAFQECFKLLQTKDKVMQDVETKDEVMQDVETKDEVMQNVETKDEVMQDVETKDEVMQDVEILNVLIASMPKSKKSSANPMKYYFYYKLLYHSFCKSYQQNPELVLEFFIWMLSNTGFSIKTTENIETVNSSINFDNSILSVVALLEVIATINLKLGSSQIYKVSFSKLLQDLLYNIISITHSPVDENSYKIINLIIQVSPLSIYEIITPLLKYLMSSDNQSKEKFYEETLMNVCNVYHKLNRLPHLISKMIRSLQPLYLNENPIESEKHETVLVFNGKLSESLNLDEYLELDVDKMLPSFVLEHLSNYTIGLANRHVGNMLKTLLFHLNELIGQDLAERSKEKRYVTFIEYVSRLLCNFLSKISIASSTSRAENIEKFSKEMEETVLEKFGNALLGIEHNQNLMRVFLNLSYTWGELKILLQYGIIHKTISYEVSELDSNSCNISFLHSYLPSQTWCMIAERISNFGEQQCKTIMEKLWIQKIRSLILSNINKSTINEHIATLIKTISPIEDYYEYLLSNEFSAHVILTQTDSETRVTIADCVLKDALVNEHVLKNVVECGDFILALIFSIFKKINKFFKKESKASGIKMVSNNLYTLLEEAFVVGDQYDTGNLKETFKMAVAARSENGVADASKLKEYLLLIRKLPVVYLQKHSIQMIFCYLLGVFLDLKRSDENLEVLNELETILLGIAQTKTILLDGILPMKLMLKIIIKDFKDSRAIFAQILNSSDNDNVTLSKATEFFQKYLNNEKCINCLLLLQRYIQKKKKTTDIEINQQLCHLLISIISTSYSSMHLEVLVSLLQHTKTILTNDIVKQLQAFIDRICDDDNIQITKGEILLFQFALNNYDKFNLDGDDNIIKEQQFLSNVSNTMQRVKLNTEMLYIYSSNIQIILTKVESLDEFKTFIQGNLLKQTLIAIENPDNVELQAILWQQIISLPMKTEKGEVVQACVEAIIIQLYKYITKDDCNAKYYDTLLKFLLHVIQNNQQLLTSTSLDLCFATVTQLKKREDFEQSYSQSINILEALLRYRQPLICDRLPIFLQQYRFLLNTLCTRSDATKKFDDNHYEKCAALTHLLEKLTINLCKLHAHIASLAIYIIPDFLKEFETITIYPAVKLSLNNCLNNLFPLCNKHEISCLFRVLNPGSIEIFKVTYENYKKYHRFTGKV